MSPKNSILVVDDEEVVCNSCSRILSREGYSVDTQTNAAEGLKMAESTEYSAILLDLKMREMDGIEFLDQLRKKNSDVPVIVITGYPSQETANASYSLGVYDYIPKPFTPNEISDSVKKVTSRVRAAGKAAPAPAAAPAPKAAPAWESGGETARFFDEAWFRIGDDGTVQVGALLPGVAAEAIASLEPPAEGSAVHRGLPLCTLRLEDGSAKTIPSPVSGKIVQVNRESAGKPASLIQDPFGSGWIARVQTTQLDDDLLFCKTRNVVLASRAGRGEKQKAHLTGLGCKVFPARSLDETVQALRSHESAVLLFDGESFGVSGPDAVRQLCRNFPQAKVVVLGSDPAQEAAYRASKIFFYAVNPFEDMEILDILHNAFRSPDRPAFAEEMESKFLPKWVSRIHITNRRGSRVTLLSFGETLLYHKGVGRQLIGKLLDQAFPIETTRGRDRSTPADSVGQGRIRNEISRCDRLIALIAEKSGKIPGQLAANTRREIFSSFGSEEQRKLTTLVVETEDPSSPFAFDVRTTDALAEHLYREMVSR